MLHKKLATKKTVAEYVAHCERGLELIEHAYDALCRAEDELKLVAPYTMPSELTCRIPEMTAVRREVYRKAWIELFDQTGLRQVMDAQAEREFMESLERETIPEFNEANIRSNFVDMATQAETIFQRGIVNVFRHLSPDYKRHSDRPFEVPHRVILNGACRPSFGRGMTVNYGFHAAEINDIDRVFKVLDGEKHVARSLQSALDDCWRDEPEYEDDYYKARCHKNGNVHMTFKRADLLTKANDLIAEYYGAVLGDEQKQRRYR